MQTNQTETDGPRSLDPAVGPHVEWEIVLSGGHPDIFVIVSAPENATDAKLPSPATSPASDGSVTPDALIVAFVQGAQWWEYQKTKTTMWNSDLNLAEVEAECRLYNGTLGKTPNVRMSEGADK